MTDIHRVTALFALAAVLSTPAAAQESPDFGGVWTLESTRPDGVLSFRPSLVVGHQGDRLTSGKPGDHHTLTYTLDGRERETRSGPSAVRLKASWDGRTLVLEHSSIVPSGATRAWKQRWSLDAGKLTIVHTEVAKDALTTVTAVYVKK